MINVKDMEKSNLDAEEGVVVLAVVVVVVVPPDGVEGVDDKGGLGVEVVEVEVVGVVVVVVEGSSVV